MEAHATLTVGLLWLKYNNAIRFIYMCNSRLAKRREIPIFPRTVGNTGNSPEILVIPGNYWEIGPLPSRKLKLFHNSHNYIYKAKNN